MLSRGPLVLIRIRLRLVFGTPTFRVDLVDANIKLTPTLNTRALSKGPFFSFPHSHKGGSFAQVKILGSLLEIDYVSRNNDVSEHLDIACSFY